MKFVLMIISSVSAGHTVSMQEFESLKACEYARSVYIEMAVGLRPEHWRRLALKDIPENAKCIPKGDGAAQ